ncbi:hypothetical protein [Rhodococcus globerulus]|uniref:hypothetical protein n=1 Tax=Rhodococcus globerulus TaxID=33008 RepID=UPI0005248B96|nr:hypothetical protein [Rhodococcus globerulus]PVX59567.1 hypothetical protein C8E04_6140 [Rhodococcus globerulus]
MPFLHTRVGRLSRWTRTFRLGRRTPASTQRNQPPAEALTYDEQVELLDAYRALRDAEKRTGATLGYARGADMSDAATVRALAKMLDGLGAGSGGTDN